MTSSSQPRVAFVGSDYYQTFSRAAGHCEADLLSEAFAEQGYRLEVVPAYDPQVRWVEYAAVLPLGFWGYHRDIEAFLRWTAELVQKGALPPDSHVVGDAPEEDRAVVAAAPEKDRQRADPRGVRVLGPYRHEGAWRCRIVTSAGRSWAPTAATETAALQGAEKLAATLARQGSITICDSIEAYVRSKEVAGARPSTLDGNRRALIVYFTGILDWPVGRLTSRRAQECYDALQIWVGPRGHTLSVATHRSYVHIARSWGRWVVAKGWMRGPSPVDVVKGVGRKKRGKPQLSLDEARLLYAAALEVARQGDEGGVAVLMAISMGLRTSEILSRTPRDLDNAGTVVRISDNLQLGFKAKNDSAKRPVTEPLDLQPILARMCEGKLPTAPLFPSEKRPGRRPRQWMPVQVTRLCELAKVPKVCPHSLRGVSATAAAAAGRCRNWLPRCSDHFCLLKPPSRRKLTQSPSRMRSLPHKEM